MCGYTVKTCCVVVDDKDGFFNTMQYNDKVRVRVMVFNATFNNISVISWQSVLLVEVTGVLTENSRKLLQTISHNVVSCTPLLSGIQICNVSGDRY